jgi:hypothetical protein
MRLMKVATPLVVAVVVVACGNLIDTEIIGKTGLTRSADGSVVILVNVCTDSVDHVGVYGSREGLAQDQQNSTLGELHASKPQSGFVEVALAAPESPWTTDPVVQLPDDPGSLFIVIANTDGDTSTQAAQVSATRHQVNALPQGSVLVSSAKQIARSEFDSSC